MAWGWRPANLCRRGAARRGRPSRASGGVDGRRPGLLGRGGHQNSGNRAPWPDPACTLIRVVEACSKPVVAALQQRLHGRGLELALGCHYQWPRPRPRWPCPKGSWAWCLGWWHTAPAAPLGVEPALNMILSGEQVPCELLAMAPGQKLFDRLLAPVGRPGRCRGTGAGEGSMRVSHRWCATWSATHRMPTLTSSFARNSAWRRRSPLSRPRSAALMPSAGA